MAAVYGLVASIYRELLEFRDTGIQSTEYQCGCTHGRRKNVGLVRPNAPALRSVVPGVCLLFLLPMMAAVLHAKTPEQLEYELKAAFIYNFMRFIEWPETKTHANRRHDYGDEAGEENNVPPPMIVGIVGKDPFGCAFDQVLERKINNREIKIVHIGSLASYVKSSRDEDKATGIYKKQYSRLFQRCDIVFISDSESGYIHYLLPLAVGSAAVTISDIPDFVRGGGMIGFTMEKQKVRFDINLVAAKKENIQIRSQLLELAGKVINEKKRK